MNFMLKIPLIFLQDYFNATTEEDESDSTADVLEVKRPHAVGLRTRSFSSIPSDLQAICQRAQRFVNEYTLFTNPFLSSVDVLHLLSNAWTAAQEAEQDWQERTRECDSVVSRLFTSPLRRRTDIL